MNPIQVNKLHSLTGHRDSIYALQIGKNSRDLFSAGADGMVVQWNLAEPETGELVAKLPNSIFAIHYLELNDLLAVGQNFEGIHLIDCRSKKETASLKLTNSYIFDITSHKNNLICACGDGSVVIIDVESWRVINRLELSKQSTRAIVVNKNNDELVVGYSDNFVRVFDLSDFKLKHQWVAHNNSVFTISLNLNDRFLVSGSRDAKLKIWDASNRYEIVEEIVAHMYTINHIAFSPDNKHFVTCSMDKSIKVWDSNEFRLLKVIDKSRHAGHGNSVNKLVWTSFNNQLVSASDDKTLSIWDIIF